VPVLELPTDFVRPAIQSTKGSNAYLHLEAALTTGLHDLSKNAGTTLFMTLLAAFKVLLHRYSGQQDICVGTPIAGRTQQETEGLIGFFVNTLALRTNLSGNPSFRALLEKVKATTLESYEHQDVPFEKIVESVVTERDLSGKPLFQVMFALQNIQESGTPELQGISTRFESHGTKRSKFDLTFTLAEREKGIDLYVEYCTDLFKAATIDRMMQHYLRLLHSAITNPAQNIGQLSMLLPPEEEKILNEFNNTAVDYPKNKTIVDLFIQQAKQTPGNTAIVFENQRLTYQQLDERSGQLAHYICKSGVTTESPAAICFDRSLEMMVAILAILKAGGAYVPIDPGYPLERISYMLEDTGAVTVITNQEWMNVIPASYMGRLIVMDAEWAEISKEPATCPPVDIKAGHLAYIIYTSGSTGKPKGVMVEHRNVVSLVQGVDYVSLSAADALLATGSPSFDATTFEYWGMLLHGGKLVLCKEAQLLDSQLLKAQVVRHAVTKMWFTTGWLNQLIDTDISIFENLSTVITGGEKASEHHLARLHAAYPALEIINAYGPTENTTFSLSCKVTSGHLQKTLPVGRPLENRTAYVLDKHNHLCPVGVVGEICVGGEGLARGYLNKPELTSEKFISNPVGKEAGSRLYRTGDLGRWLPDGNIEFLGRIDNQVKIRGYRIEPDEISTAVQQSGFVRQSIVIARQDKTGNHRLVGYVVAGGEFSKESLVSYLKKQLPDYMVPNTWVELPSIPLNANGKVDKAALPDVDEADLAAGVYVAPRTALEATLAGIWQEALGVERVGMNDNFFALGGHSLLLIEVITRAKEHNCHLQFEDLFEHQTIAELSAHLGSANGVTQIETGHPNIKLLNRGSAVQPLFLLPGSPGFCDGYEELTGALAGEYKIYGLQMTGLREGEEPLHTIQAIAGQCLQWIQQIQPGGPYRFIGHSLGASVAFDMAQLLEEKGEQVEFICILDKPVHFTMTTEFKDAMLVKSLVELLRNTEHVTGTTPPWIMQLESMLAGCPAGEKISFIMDFVQQNLGAAKNTGFVLRILYALLIQTDMDHDPHGKVNANMLLVKAAEENWPCSEYLGWEGHAQNIQLINTPGDHRTMVRNHHATILAAQIKKSIQAIKQF
jgi:amino acid adenylation domain-containing protein